MRYQLEIWHDGLKRREIVKASSEYEVRLKAESKLAQWDMQYKMKSERSSRQAYVDSQKSVALQATEDASSKIFTARNFLYQITSGYHVPEFGRLLKHLDVDDPQPVPPNFKDFPAEPKLTDPDFTFTRTFFDRVVPGSLRKKQRAAERIFGWAHERWLRECANIDEENSMKEGAYNKAIVVWQKGIEEKTRLNNFYKLEF